jgi:hypothetical protein
MRKYKVGDYVSHYPNNGKNRMGYITAISNDDDRYFTYQIRFDDGSGRQWVHRKNINLIHDVDEVNPNSMEAQGGQPY